MEVVASLVDNREMGRALCTSEECEGNPIGRGLERDRIARERESAAGVADDKGDDDDDYYY